MTPEQYIALLLTVADQRIIIEQQRVEIIKLQQALDEHDNAAAPAANGRQEEPVPT